MTKTPDEKLNLKRQVWQERTAMALGVPEAEALALLKIERQQSLRLNNLKPGGNVTAALQQLGWRGKPYPWMDSGLSVESGLDVVRDSHLVSEGNVYIQNAASWLPVLALDPQPGESILDMCAAPGGKTSHIAALSDNQARITANDNSRPRLAKLRANLTRLGIENVDYTLYDATQLARKLAGREYDKILLDAPCSGEGMMQYGRDKDFETWSVAQIKRLQQLQKRLISQAWQLLKPGGTLLYSTCTMAPEENEAVVDYLLRHNADVSIIAFELALPNRISTVQQWNGKPYDVRITQAMRLKPSPNIEAFFVCKLRKSYIDR